MNSTELIAQADRRYEEMRGESRGWAQGSWCSGYINGWMDHHGEGYRAGVEAMRDAARRECYHGEHGGQMKILRRKIGEAASRLLEEGKE